MKFVFLIEIFSFYENEFDDFFTYISEPKQEYLNYFPSSLEALSLFDILDSSHNLLRIHEAFFEIYFLLLAMVVIH